MDADEMRADTWTYLTPKGRLVVVVSIYSKAADGAYPVEPGTYHFIFDSLKETEDAALNDPRLKRYLTPEALSEVRASLGGGYVWELDV